MLTVLGDGKKPVPFTIFKSKTLSKGEKLSDRVTVRCQRKTVG